MFVIYYNPGVAYKKTIKDHAKYAIRQLTDAKNSIREMTDCRNNTYIELYCHLVVKLSALKGFLHLAHVSSPFQLELADAPWIFG